MKLLLHIVGWLMRQLEKTNVLSDDAILLHWCHLYRAHGLERPPYIGMDNIHSVSTQAVTGILETQVTANGTIEVDSLAPDATERGFVYNAGAATPELGASSNVFETGTFAQGSGAFALDITGLTASTLYSVRAYAINSVGTGYGETVTVTTADPPATDFSGGSGSSVNISASGSGTPATSGGSGIDVNVTAAGAGEGPAPSSEGIYWTDFSEYTTGVQPSDWSLLWGADTTLTVIDESGVKALQMVISAGNRVTWKWDAVPVGSKFKVFMQHKVEVDAVQVYARTKASGAAGTETSFDGSLSSEVDRVRYSKYVNGTFTLVTNFTSTTQPINVGTIWNVLFEIDGNSVKIKAWEEGQTEPVNWDDEVTDADALAAVDGSVGIGSFGAATYKVLKFGVSTTDDPAPREEPAGGSDFSGGSGSVVNVSPAGSGQPAVSGGSGKIVNVSTQGVGQPNISEGSSSSVDITAQGSGQPAVSEGSNTAVNVTSDGSGQPDVSDGNSSVINITSDGLGSPAISEGSDSAVVITAVGAGQAEGANDFSGGSSSQVNVTASGTGSPAIEEGSSDSLNITVQGAGTPAVDAGSSDQVNITPSGSGSVDISDGSFADVVITPSGDGSPDVEDGSSTTITITAVGAGVAQFEGAFAGGSGSSVGVTAEGSGLPAISGGSSTAVNITATGAGTSDEPLALSGGSSSSVSIEALGSGTPSISGGSGAEVIIFGVGRIPYDEISDEEWELMAETIKLITRRKVACGIPTLKLHEGTNLEQDFLWLDKNEEPMDLATWGAEFGVKLRKRDDAYVIYASSYNSDAYITVEPDGEKGLIRINVPYHEFYDLNMVWGVWDLVMVPDVSMPTVRRLKILDGAAVYIQRVIDVEDPLVTLLLDDLGEELWDNNSQPLVF